MSTNPNRPNRPGRPSRSGDAVFAMIVTTALIDAVTGLLDVISHLIG